LSADAEIRSYTLLKGHRQVELTRLAHPAYNPPSAIRPVSSLPPMLRLLILSDGKPGHYKKSQAIAREIAEQRACRVEQVEIRMRLALWHNVLRPMFRRHRQLPDGGWFRWCYRCDSQPGETDLIISSGGKTAYANAWLAQQLGCANVFIGGTRGVHDAYFSRIVIHDDTRVGDPRFIRSLIPTDITAERLRASVSQYATCRDGQFLDQRHWALLIGGNSGGYRYTNREWRWLIDALPILAERHGIRWLVTTSRRTPRAVEELLRSPELQSCIDDLVIFRTDERRVYNAFLGKAEVIVCTEDSGTMLTEAAATGRPVLSVRPQTARTTAALKRLLDFYSSCDRLRRFPIGALAALEHEDAHWEARGATHGGLGQVGARILEMLPRAA